MMFFGVMSWVVGVELMYKFLLIKERLKLFKLAFSDVQILH